MSTLRLTGLAALAAVVGVLAFASAGVAAAPSTSSTCAVTVPINTSDVTGTFSGVLCIVDFAVQNGQVVAVGTLTGTVTTATGVVQSIVTDVVLPLISVDATCHVSILHLELGPLDLNLLGVMVHLDQVVLDISAQSGPGNLLGNLLCAVSNLANGGAATALANLLNSLLGLI
jgi:hypothetical protein